MHSSSRFASDPQPKAAHRLRAGGLLLALAGLLALSNLANAEQGLTQPPSLTPRSSPYPTTSFPSLRGVIVQPTFVAPSQEAAGDEVVVSDGSSAATAQAPPKLASQIVRPREFEPGPVIAVPAKAELEKAEPAKAEPKKSSRFWEMVLGPSQPPVSEASASAAPKSVSATAVNSDSRPNSGVGGSLMAQLLGTNSPPRRPTPAPAPPAQIDPFLKQLQLASAEAETSTTTEQRKPTVRDVEEAKTPATSMTISRPGWMQQLGVPTEPPAEPAPTSTGLPPVPTVPAGAWDRFASALWRPLAMTNDAPMAPMPEASVAFAASQLPESERMPGLLRPFYATNPPVRSNAPGGAPSAEATVDSAESLTDMFVQSSLGRQMTLATSDDLRTPMTAAIEAQVRRDREPWDGQVTIQWPLMANPFTITDAGDPRSVANESNIAHAAFLQEPLPVPTNDGATPDVIDLPGNQGGSADDEEPAADGADEKKDEPDSLVGAKTIGTAPEDNTLEFLRTQTVLLQPGKSQFDIGIEYTLTENNFPILLTDQMGNVVGVDDVEFKGRELTVPMELRYGLLNRVQGFIQVPVGWANVQAAINDYDEFENDGGLGDIGFGLTAQLRDAYKDSPYLIGTLAGLAPTGGDPFGVFGVISPNAPSLGNGFWAISGNLLWVQTRYDPVVVYYGLGARYQFEHEYFGIEFEPGTEYNYTLGTGFAVNERVTLSAQFFGSYIEEIKANGERVEGTIQEPMNLRLAATLAKPCNRLVEPFVIFGLTDDAISANFGITWTY